MSLFHIDAGQEWKSSHRQTFFLVKELKHKGYPVFLVAQPKSPLYQRALEADLPVFPVNMRNGLGIYTSLRIAKAMRRNHCVLAHFHEDRALAVGMAAARMAKVPIRIISSQAALPLKRKHREEVDKIITISEGVRMLLLRNGIRSDFVEVIPNGIDFSALERAAASNYLRREFSFAQGDYLIGILAHLADKEGYKHLIQATKILRAWTERIKVIVFGDGPLNLDLQKETKKLSGDGLFFILGFRKHLPYILTSLDLFVLPSYLEGLRSYVIYAMACRLPVVVIKTGGIPEVVRPGETAFVVPPSDSSSLANAILTLYRDKEYAARLAQRGYEVVQKKFSTQSMAEKVISLYERIAYKRGINIQK